MEQTGNHAICGLRLGKSHDLLKAVYESNSKPLSEDNMYISDQDVCDDIEVNTNWDFRKINRSKAARTALVNWNLRKRGSILQAVKLAE